MLSHEFKSLLDQANSIVSRYKKADELTGENFNVFRILKLSSAEVRMHSAFIAELLDPHGSHGQKDIFLKLFLDRFCFKGQTVDAPSCKVEVEKDTGRISEDKLQGGRIDIIITDKNRNKLIIENKIYAGDQECQMKRYHNHAPNADLIYLTLDGKQPEQQSIVDLQQDTHYRCCSYKRDIADWLELCRKEVAIYPVIREAITHYINLIKYLTNQTSNNVMQNELSVLVKSNLDAAWQISESIDDACQLIADDFCEKMKEICRQKGLEFGGGINFKEKYSGIWIWKPDWKYVSIAFQFQNWDKWMGYGISREPEIEVPKPTIDAIVAIPDSSLKEDNPHWLWNRLLDDPFDNWKLKPAWKAVLDGRMEDMMFEKIEQLIKATEGMEL